MHCFSYRLSARLAGAIFSLLLAATAAAQSPATGQDPIQDPTQGSTQGSAPAPATGPRTSEDEWLAKAANVYFSSARAGLTGFDCDVHPDWRALVVSASKGKDIAASDAYLGQLKNVTVKMHARMQGGSTIEWQQNSSDGQRPSDDMNAAIDAMHQTVQQILEGFMQFWSPFMEVTVVPKKADGLEITHGITTHTIYTRQGTTELMEIFNKDLVLEHFNLMLAGTSIKLSPTFEPTPQGMLVKTFAAEIQPAGTTPQQSQKMMARVDYQTVNSQTIPGQLSMEISGTGNFNFAFDGCSTN
jgi:hypothetical protein